MAQFYYDNHNSKELTVSFSCDDCLSLTRSDPIPVPSPHYRADNRKESRAQIDGNAVCYSCERVYEFTLYSDWNSGWGIIGGARCDGLEVDVLSAIDAHNAILTDMIASSSYRQLKDSLAIVAVLTEDNRIVDHEFGICVMAHLHCISALERYLAGLFTAAVIDSEQYKRKWLETDDVFVKQKFSLSEIHSKLDGLNQLLVERIDNMSFHSISKIFSMYRSVLALCVNLTSDTTHPS